VQQTLKRLIASRFVKACEGFPGNQLYGITAAGLKHPQRDGSVITRKRLGFLLNRTAFDAGALRIRDLTGILRVPHQSINALIQYLKQRHLIEKTGQEFNAPYSLTDEGRAVLAEMSLRHAA
jgi:DNA-binding MarR family transcriptional regulator